MEIMTARSNPSYKYIFINSAFIYVFTQQPERQLQSKYEERRNETKHKHTNRERPNQTKPRHLDNN
jgi:hypothetical protein